jgi:hypothetical protein
MVRLCKSIPNFALISIFSLRAFVSGSLFWVSLINESTASVILFGFLGPFFFGSNPVIPEDSNADSIF